MALADEPAAARQFPPQQARRVVVLDLPDPVRRFAVRRVHRQRPAADRLLQRRGPIPCSLRLSGGQVRRLRGARRLSRPLRRRRDQGARLDDLAADPFRQFDHHPQSADAAADAADLDAERRCSAARRSRSRAQRTPQRSPVLAAGSNRSGSAPIRTGTTSSPGSSTAFASRCCSGSRSPASRR